MADLAIKKILMQKKINDVVYGIHPETEASVVKYGADSTVAKELGILIAAVNTEGGSVDTKIATAVTNMKKEIMGYTDQDEINTAYDTIKEIAAWLGEDKTGAAAVVSRIGTAEQNITDLQNKLTTPETGIEARLDKLDGTAGEIVGLKAVDAGLRSDVDTLKNTTVPDLDNAYKAADTELENKIKTINETTIPDLDNAYKAADDALKRRIDSTDVTKTQIVVKPQGTTIVDAEAKDYELYMVEIA